MLSVKDLTIFIKKETENKIVVNEAHFTVEKGQTTALIGQSGSGKTLSALAIMKLLPSQFLYKGKIICDEIDLSDIDEENMRMLRGKKIAYTLQGAAALNPSMKVKKQLFENNNLDLDNAKELLNDLGLDENILNLFPHQLSAGMRQRVLLAIALANNPDYLIADEPTNGLDTTIAFQIIKLLKRIQAERQMGLLLITHDLGIVSQIADDISIMYNGKIIETNSSINIFSKPKEDYTKELIESALLR